MRNLSVFLLSTAVLCATGAAGLARAPQAGADRVEEDWVIEFGDHDLATGGPQGLTVMCPVSNGSEPFIARNFNYREVPTFQDGGMDVVVNGDDRTVTHQTLSTDPINIANETMSWTQRLSLGGGEIHYALPALSSATLGSYTGRNDDVVHYPTTLSSLDAYDPDRSLKKSGITWQRNWVKSMRLTQVRYYSGSQLLSTDSTPRQVDLSF